MSFLFKKRSKSVSEMEIPESFYCPISFTIMVDPVIDPEGNSYERTAIEEWVKKDGTSPITRTPLSLDELRPNRALKDSIEKIRDQIPSEKLKKEPSASAHSSNSNSNNNNDNEADLGPVAKGPTMELEIEANGTEVLVSVVPPEGKKRSPVDIALVVDCSGSMGTEATLKTAAGGTESHGLSLLDVVKHACKTVIHNLNGSDRLSLIAFESTARVVMDLKKMDAGGQKKALSEVDSLQEGGTTNLWDGLHNGLEVLRKGAAGKNSMVCVLTDGCPNVVPPRGHLPMLQKYKDEHPSLSCIVSTFGFGYNLDSQLLDELAVEGHGAYSFIPDASFVGTVFVNSLAGVLTTHATNVKLSIEPQNGAVLKNELPGGQTHEVASWGMEISLGSVLHGQSRDFVIPFEKLSADSSKPFICATLKADNFKTISKESASREHSKRLLLNKYRLMTADKLREAMSEAKANRLGASKDVIKRLSAQVHDAHSSVKKEKFMVDLVKDIDGQATEAFSRQDYYQKWGQHYVPSLGGAHKRQACNNFKDPGVQHYGGTLFKKERDAADAAFLKLPPPKPTIKKYDHSTGRSVSYAQQSSMSSYHCSYNPCFSGDCLVKMADGSLQKVCLLKKGDSVFCPHTRSSAKVVVVVKTRCEKGRADLCCFESGLRLTPYHPIRLEGEWKFPCDVKPIEKKVECPFVFSFLLDQGHSLSINGIECVGLASHFTGNYVIEHPYFATERVTHDLEKMKGFQKGKVNLKTGCLLHDSLDGRVCGLVQN